MSEIKSYEDLLIWKKGITIVKLVYELVKTFPQKEIYALSSQLKRASVSIPSNIAEGYGRSSTQSYIHFVSISRGSLFELETQLSKVLTHEAEINLALKSSLENQKNLAPVANRLNQLFTQVAQLPMNALPVTGAPTVASHAGAQTVIQKVMAAIQSLGDQLMRIQVVGDVKDVAMTPAAQDLIRQQLRLHFLSARLAWLSQLPQATRDDLIQAEKLIAKHFQAQASSVVQIQKNISELRAEVSKSIPVNKGQ